MKTKPAVNSLEFNVLKALGRAETHDAADSIIDANPTIVRSLRTKGLLVGNTLTATGEKYATARTACLSR